MELRWLLTAVIIHSSIILFILVLLYNVSYHTVSVFVRYLTNKQYDFQRQKGKFPF